MKYFLILILFYKCFVKLSPFIEKERRNIYGFDGSIFCIYLMKYKNIVLAPMWWKNGTNFLQYNHYKRVVLPFFLKCMNEHNKNRGLYRATSFVLSRVEEFRATYWVICALPRIYTLYSSNGEDGMRLAIKRKSKRRKEERERERKRAWE